MSRQDKTKFIFVTGGVLSSLGKGLTAASLGSLLKSKGLTVSMQKLDPYLNLDPGTMSPHQHGEVYVTDDGAETDMDLGHYERYLGVPMTERSSYTAGRIYSKVLDQERGGFYDGRTVQVIPHVTDEIKQAIMSMSTPELDVVLVEVGGTVGDIEGQPFLEALRQLKHELGKNRALFVHLTLVPYLATTREHKSKPTQHSVKELRSFGIQPDIIICRTNKPAADDDRDNDDPIGKDAREKIALFCDVSPKAVFTAVDVDNIHALPIKLYHQGLERQVSSLLRLGSVKPDIKPWEDLVELEANIKDEVDIAIVGKYTNLSESYKSLHEALKHGGLPHKVKINLSYFSGQNINSKNVASMLGHAQGILVPGGFGPRAIEGMIKAITYARTNNIPFFGICLGLQCAVIEIARNLAGLKRADSEEFNVASPHPVIFHMASWYDPKTGLRAKRAATDARGGTMRLGSYPCVLEPGTRAYEAYQTNLIHERHRHRFEVNPDYAKQLTDVGMVVSGQVPGNPLDNPSLPKPKLIEIIEVKDHPWFLGCQFHPEFKSYPMTPHPLFKAFVAASLKCHPQEGEQAEKGHGRRVDPDASDKASPKDKTKAEPKAKAAKKSPAHASGAAKTASPKPGAAKDKTEKKSAAPKEAKTAAKVKK